MLSIKLQSPVTVVVVLPLLAAFAAITSCNRSSAHGPLPIGAIDVPPLGHMAVLKDKAEFFGWGFAEGGLREVNLYVDGRYLATATLGIARPDVAKVFPQASGTSGWHVVAGTTGISAGRHEFIIQGVAKTGAVRDFGVIHAEVRRP